MAERGDNRPTARAVKLDLARRVAALRDAGRMGEAEAACRAALAAAADDAELHNLLGILLMEQGRHGDAAACYNRAIELAPDMPGAYANLGRVLWLQNRHDEAVAACRRAIAIDPGLMHAHANLGTALRSLGDFAAAETALRQAIAVAPNADRPHNNLGLLLAAQGRQDEAIACFERALAVQPDSAAAHFYLAQYKPFASGDPRIAAMRALLERRRLPAQESSFLLFGLGRAFDQLGDYDTAFGYYADANRARRTMLNFDIAAETRTVERLIAAFPAARLARAESFGCPEELPIFIAGLPRSGKSLVERVLAQHPRVRGAGETYALTRISLQLPQRLRSDKPFPDCVAALTAAQAGALGREYVAALLARFPDALRTVDTRPYNAQLVGLIRLLLPRARVIHCTRDPLDLCLQCYFQNFGGQPYAFDLRELAGFHLASGRLMAHWRDALPDRIIEVRYEDLVRDPVAESRRLFAFCGLDWGAAFPGRGGGGPEAAAFPVPLHDAEIGHWRRYARQLEPLVAALAAGGVDPTAPEPKS